MAFNRRDLQAGFRLNHCLVQPLQNRIVCDNEEPVHVEPRVMEVLVCLAEHASDVVSREVLNKQVWGNTIVTDQAVTNCISELRQLLGDKRSAHRIIETIPKRGYRLVAPIELADRQPPPDHPASVADLASAGRKTAVMAAGLLVLVLLAITWSLNNDKDPELKSIAVTPFENAAADDSLDYLAFALPDEIATLLTRSPTLAVRPSGYLTTDDALAEARQRRVSVVVSGRFYLEDGDQITVAVEAQEASQARVLWRARLTVPASDLLHLRERLTERVRAGLLPALGADDPDHGPTPVNDDAYRLYLHSLAMPYQPQPNVRAIDMLEQVVALDPGFALAWVALGRRYYDHGTYGPGGQQARLQAVTALRKSLELDPDLIPAAEQLITALTEAGDLVAAHRDAAQLVAKFDASTEAHAALAYVYRFAGALDSAQRHCELALQRDPHRPLLRSCAYSFLYDGKLSRVMAFLNLDEGSYFSQWGTVLYHLRRQDNASALSIARQAAPDATRQLMEPCLEGKRDSTLDEAAATFVQYWQRHDDPEARYAVAPMLSYCGYTDAALTFLQQAVDGKFCAYPALDRDPVWADLRDNPQFQRIRDDAIACHQQFLQAIAASADALGNQPR